MKKFDVVIIGAGPGGYVAAIRAAKSGLSVAIVEGDELGGTCLNRGCIPSKTLLKHAEVADQLKHAKTYGFNVSDFSIAIEEVVNRKNNVIKQLRQGIQGLLSLNKITLYKGLGYANKQKQVTIKSDDKEETIEAKHIILATGSSPVIPPIPGVEDVHVYTSDTVFDIEEVPTHLVIVGGGVIGIEIACVFNSFGTKVEVVEMADRILPLEDEEAGAFLAKELTNKGVTFHTNAKVVKFTQDGTATKVEVEKNNEKQIISTDKVLMSVGRTPNITGFEELSLAFDGPFVKVNGNMETSLPGIYAIGDIIGGYQLAHAASNEGMRAVHHILGQTNKKQAIIPRCVYSFPEIASVGMSESEAKAAGHRVKVKKIDLAGNGKAISANENKGFMKVIADEKYGEVLGVVMVGAHVTEMISQATAFMHLEGTVEEMETMVFPHPTLSEGLFEAASAWLGKGIHYT